MVDLLLEKGLEFGNYPILVLPKVKDVNMNNHFL
jgi:hypothetical protein